jgi:hypothetical protein
MPKFIEVLKGLMVKLFVGPLKVSFSRFPDTLIASFVLGILMISYNEWFSQEEILLDISVTIFLFLPMTLFVTLLREKIPAKTLIRWIDRLIIMVLATSFFIFIRLENSDAVTFNKFANLMTAFYVLPVFIPVLFSRKDVPSFIVVFFTRFLTALFYGLMLFTGISIILLSYSVLFSVFISLTTYANYFIGIMTFIFMPIFLSSYPKKDEIIQFDHVAIVWKRVFSFVIAPVITVFSFLIIAYLLTSSINNATYQPVIYTFSTLVIAFAGISSQFVLEAMKKDNLFINLFVKYFHYILLAVMLGYYVELIRLGTQQWFGLVIIVQLILGVWPVTYSVLKIVNHQYAKDISLLTLVGAYVWIAVLPFGNAVSVTVFSLNQKLVSVLNQLDMIDDQGEVIRRVDIPQSDFNVLYNVVGEMNDLGLNRFSMIPDDFEYPYDFPEFFGISVEDENRPNESFNYTLNAPVLDFSSLDFDYFVTIFDIKNLEGNPYTSGSLEISLTSTVDFSFPLTVSVLTRSLTIELYEDVAQALQESFGTPFYQSDDIDDFTLIFEHDDLKLTFIVSTLSVIRNQFYSEFFIGFYLAIKLK